MRPGYPNDYDETYEGTKDLFDSAIYSFGINYLGFPAGNVPVDLVEGLPSGIQTGDALSPAKVRRVSVLPSSW